MSYPGRRIALLVDASTSMVMQFKSPTKTQGEATFFTAVAAAEQFIRRRMNGPYRDLVALIQFGNQAYVVTPFTTDYENILLSIRLDQRSARVGTLQRLGHDDHRGDRSGDAAVQDVSIRERVGQSDDRLHRRPRLGAHQQAGRARELVAEARTWKIPVHMIRTAYNRREGEVVQDKIWRPTVERTGGRFYAVYDEESMMRALREIDRLSPGRIETREYSVQRPRYAGYALIAAGVVADSRRC